MKDIISIYNNFNLFLKSFTGIWCTLYIFPSLISLQYIPMTPAPYTSLSMFMSFGLVLWHAEFNQGHLFDPEYWDTWWNLVGLLVRTHLKEMIPHIPESIKSQYFSRESEVSCASLLSMTVDKYRVMQHCCRKSELLYDHNWNSYVIPKR